MKYIIILFLFVGTVVAYGQSNDEDIENVYKSLYQNPINFLEISKDSVVYTECENYAIFNLKNYDVSYIASRSFNPDNPIRDSLIYFGDKISIDDLLGEKDDDIEYTLSLNIASAYIFDVNDNKYLSVFAWDASIPSSNPSYYILLLNLSTKQTPLLLGSQASFNPYCFSSSNGVLYYWEWSSDFDDYIHKYSIVDGEVLLDKNISILVSYSEDGKYNINKNE